MKYRQAVATRLGGPEVLEVQEKELRMPEPGEVCIKVLAAAVCRPDLAVRSGEALYSGTPLGQKAPFVPGYAVIGEVDALGEGVAGEEIGRRVAVLTIVGGYSEYVYAPAKRLIPVPAGLDPVQAVPLVLNYIVAYQVMHRKAHVHPGDKVLVIGASGDIGMALLQLGQLAGLSMYGLASPVKHGLLRKYGATPLDYHDPDFAD